MGIWWKNNGERRMKKITLYLNDETIEVLDKVVQSYDYYKYPINQAYGLFIADLLREVQKLALCSCSIDCCLIPPHQVLSSWLCKVGIR